MVKNHLDESIAWTKILLEPVCGHQTYAYLALRISKYIDYLQAHRMGQQWKPT